MSTEELVSGVLEGLKLNALDLSALFRTALLILAGVVVIRVLLRIVDRMLSRSQNLGSVGGYIRSVVRIALWFLLVLVVADSLGIPVASMIALLSVAGLAISLALQNTLSNLAGGIMILVSKPFEVGGLCGGGRGGGHGHFHRPGVQHPGHRGQQGDLYPPTARWRRPRSSTIPSWASGGWS